MFKPLGHVTKEPSCELIRHMDTISLVKVPYDAKILIHPNISCKNSHVWTQSVLSETWRCGAVLQAAAIWTEPPQFRTGRRFTTTSLFLIFREELKKPPRPSASPALRKP